MYQHHHLDLEGLPSFFSEKFCIKCTMTNGIRSEIILFNVLHICLTYNTMGSVSNFLLTLVNIMKKGFHLYRELLCLIVHCLFFLVQVILTQKPGMLLLFGISILKLIECFVLQPWCSWNAHICVSGSCSGMNWSIVRVLQFVCWQKPVILFLQHHAIFFDEYIITVYVCEWEWVTHTVISKP